MFCALIGAIYLDSNLDFKLVEKLLLEILSS